MNIGILIYDEVEVLDFSGPFEVFSTANRFLDDANRVMLIGQDTNLVTARGGFLVKPHIAFDDHPPLDVLLIPGGIHMPQMQNKLSLTWINQQSHVATLVTSVCTGVFLLAKAGVIQDETVTTHWDDIADLKAQFPKLNVVSDKRWVETGQIVTSAGISAGIDMSLHIVELIAGKKIALKTARQMQYEWTLED